MTQHLFIDSKRKACGKEVNHLFLDIDNNFIWNVHSFCVQREPGMEKLRPTFIQLAVATQESFNWKLPEYRINSYFVWISEYTSRRFSPHFLCTHEWSKVLSSGKPIVFVSWWKNTLHNGALKLDGFTGTKRKTKNSRKIDSSLF